MRKYRILRGLRQLTRRIGKNITDIRVDGAELESDGSRALRDQTICGTWKTLKQVGVVDRNKLQVISTWPLPGAGVNTPLRWMRCIIDFSLELASLQR